MTISSAKVNDLTFVNTRQNVISSAHFHRYRQSDVDTANLTAVAAGSGG